MFVKGNDCNDKLTDTLQFLSVLRMFRASFSLLCWFRCLLVHSHSSHSVIPSRSRQPFFHIWSSETSWFYTSRVLYRCLLHSQVCHWFRDNCMWQQIKNVFLFCKLVPKNIFSHFLSAARRCRWKTAVGVIDWSISKTTPTTDTRNRSKRRRNIGLRFIRWSETLTPN